MFPTSRTTFPKHLKVNLPCYQVTHFNGKSLELIPEDQQLEVDFTRFDALSLANATALQHGGWEIRGLIAVESWPFSNAFKQALENGSARQFGGVLDHLWYQVAPIELHFTPHLGEYVVAGLHR